MSCITCGLSVTRGSCPVLVDDQVRRSYIKVEHAFDKKTFVPFDVTIGYFTYGLKDGSTPRFWWHDVPQDAPSSAPGPRKKRLQARAVFRGHKVLSRWTIADLEYLEDGPFKGNMTQMLGEMKKEYRRRVEAAKAAYRTTQSSSANEGGTTVVPQISTRPPRIQGEVSNMSSNARAEYVQQPVRRPSPVLRADRAPSVHSSESFSAQPTTGLRQASSMSTSSTSHEGSSPMTASGLRHATYPMRPREALHPSRDIPEPAPRTNASPACIACTLVHHRLGCPLVPGTFDNPTTLFNPLTFEPTPVTFGHFTCMRRENDGVAAGWKQFYYVDLNGSAPRLRSTLASPERLDKLLGRAILMGYSLDSQCPEDLELMRDRGPFFTSVQAFLASMVAEYTRRWSIANAARFPLLFSSSNPFALPNLHNSDRASEATSRVTQRPRVRLRTPNRSAYSRQQNTVNPLSVTPARFGNSDALSTSSPAESPSVSHSADTSASREDSAGRSDTIGPNVDHTTPRPQAEPARDSIDHDRVSRASQRHSQPYPSLYDEVEEVNQAWATEGSRNRPLTPTTTYELPHMSSVENIAWRASRQASTDYTHPVPGPEQPNARVRDSTARPAAPVAPDRHGARPTVTPMPSLPRLIVNSLRTGIFGQQAAPPTRHP